MAKHMPQSRDATCKMSILFQFSCYVVPSRRIAPYGREGVVQSYQEGVEHGSHRFRHSIRITCIPRVKAMTVRVEKPSEPVAIRYVSDAARL